MKFIYGLVFPLICSFASQAVENLAEFNFRGGARSSYVRDSLTLTPDGVVSLRTISPFPYQSEVANLVGKFEQRLSPKQVKD